MDSATQSWKEIQGKRNALYTWGTASLIAFTGTMTNSNILTETNTNIIDNALLILSGISFGYNAIAPRFSFTKTKEAFNRAVLIGAFITATIGFGIATLQQGIDPTLILNIPAAAGYGFIGWNIFKRIQENNTGKGGAASHLTPK